MRLYLSSFRLGNKPEELLKLLKGKKHAAVIANSMDFVSNEDRTQSVERELTALRGIGLEPEEIDLRKYFGKKEKLRNELLKFNLVWVRGGNVFILRNAFYKSGFDEIIMEMLKNDSIVYGGYSAGPMMLTPSLRGAELVDDLDLLPKEDQLDIIWNGLNLIPYALAPHYKSDHPESAAVEKEVQYLIDHNIPYKTLHDGEAIVVNGSSEKLVK